jgi:ubiquinone/menaquinone biosynthesis C-methylase UbiE
MGSVAQHGRRHRDVGRFDAMAATYDQHFLQSRLFEPVQALALDAAQRHRPDASAILDVGCGTGRLLHRARGVFPNARLVGVDASLGMIETARRSTDHDIEFLVGEAEELVFGDASFDLVLSTLSFHHWHDQREGLRQIHRVLRPRGVIVLSDMVLQWWMVPFAVVSRARGRTHTLTEFRHLLRAGGFVPLQQVALPHVFRAVGVMVARAA